MSERLTTEGACARLLRWRQAGGYSARVTHQEQRALRRLLPRLGKALGRVTRDDVERLLAARLERAKPATVARELLNVRALYRVLLEEELVRHDPTAGLRVKIGAQRQLVISAEGVQRLLVEASRVPRARRSPSTCEALALRNRVLLELLYGLGVRAAEACGLCLVDLDLAARTLRVARVKRGKPAALPLAEALVPHLARYLAAGRPVLLQGRDLSEGRLLVNERGRPLTVNHLERLVARVAARAGVEAHPHALRRTLATHLVREGAALPAVQSLLGHRRLNSTQRYVGPDLTDLRTAVESLDWTQPKRRGAARVPPPSCLSWPPC
ncbi:MAG: tyrosine-type recombinase/integrase [Planctomycetota bacterium]